MGGVCSCFHVDDDDSTSIHCSCAGCLFQNLKNNKHENEFIQQTQSNNVPPPNQQVLSNATDASSPRGPLQVQSEPVEQSDVIVGTIALQEVRLLECPDPVGPLQLHVPPPNQQVLSHAKDASSPRGPLQVQSEPVEQYDVIVGTIALQQVQLLVCPDPVGPPELQSLKSSAKDGSIHMFDHDDECPTCLVEYTPENPKIMTKCFHHYHLSCIYEWLERSETCPVCGKLMLFDE